MYYNTGLPSHVNLTDPRIVAVYKQNADNYLKLHISPTYSNACVDVGMALYMKEAATSCALWTLDVQPSEHWVYRRLTSVDLHGACVFPLSREAVGAQV